MNGNRKVLFLFFFLIGSPGYSQLNNDLLNREQKVDSSRSDELYFELFVLGFGKNNEYFNRISDGYTLLGYQLIPSFSYYFSKNFKLNAGVYLRKDFGSHAFKVGEPVFTLSYFKNNFNLNMGTLDGRLSHQLIEPLYDFDRLVLEDPENGIQTKYVSEGLFADLWVSWEKMLYRGEESQEKIFGGTSVKKRILKINNFQFFIPFQAVAYHKGGQIDRSAQPLVTLTNWVTGVEFQRDLPESSVIKKISGSGYYVYSKDLSSQAHYHYFDGAGWYLNTSLHFRSLETMLSYWKGNEFSAEKGGPLYQSVSRNFHFPNHIEEIRKLLFLRAFYTYGINKNVSLQVRFEPVFDIINESLDYSYGFYLAFDNDFFLLKTHKK